MAPLQRDLLRLKTHCFDRKMPQGKSNPIHCAKWQRDYIGTSGRNSRIPRFRKRGQCPLITQCGQCCVKAHGDRDFEYTRLQIFNLPGNKIKSSLEVCFSQTEEEAFFRPAGDQLIQLDRSRSQTCTEPSAPALRAAFLFRIGRRKYSFSVFSV